MPGVRTVLTETDLELVDAVQVNPRASWVTIGATLGISAVTAARRWGALSAQGAVWTGSVMGPKLFRGAVVEIRCRPRTTESVIAALCAMPDVFTVARTVGEFDLYALTVTPSAESLTASLLGPIADLDTDRVRSQAYSRVFGGHRWRLSVLNQTQTEQVRAHPARPLRRVPVAAADRRLFRALAHDARRSYSDLATELDSSPQSVRRQLERMERGGYIAFRADLARPLAGWPLAALLWLTVPDADVDTVGREVGAWIETRFCAAVASSTTLLLIVNLRAVEQLEQIVARLVHAHPAVAVTDRRLVVRMSKVNGRILDEEGRSRHVVPVDPWAAEKD